MPYGRLTECAFHREGETYCWISAARIEERTRDGKGRNVATRGERCCGGPYGNGLAGDGDLRALGCARFSSPRVQGGQLAAELSARFNKSSSETPRVSIVEVHETSGCAGQGGPQLQRSE